MRHAILITTIVIVAVLAMGCTQTEGIAAKKPIQDETMAMKRDEVKTETKEAVLAMRDYTYARKDEFVADTQKELAGIQVEMDRLAVSVDRSKGEAKAEAKVRLDAVRENWAQAKNQLDQAGAATESTWNDVKRGFEKSRDALKYSFDDTRQWLSDKIEP